MKWDLTKIFKTIEEFNEAYNYLMTFPSKAKAYEGKLNDSVCFKEFFQMQREFEEKASKLYLYAHLNSDLNKKDVEKATLVQKCMVMLHMYMQSVAFEEPELLSLGYERVMELLKENPDIEEFKFSFEKLFHSNEHVLDKKSEQLISVLSPAMRNGSELYSMLSTADGNPTEIIYNGKPQFVTQGNWTSLVEFAKSEEDRQKVFEAIFNTYEKHKNTYAKIYDSILESNKAIQKARGYKSILEAHLFGNNIPTSVYETLVEVAGSENEALKRYIKLRKKHLKLERYRTYHRFLQFATSDKKYSYDDAKELFFKSIEKFPQEFQDYAHSALESGYVDVMEKDGKRTGAYSSGVCNFHPFILLNYSDTLSDVFTVAHEAGHSIHSLYAGDAQPPMLQDYTIFVAEIASTFNEHNLLDYLMSTGKLSKEEQIMLLQKAIDSIMGTFYRQTLFAEYELTASRMKEQDMPINHEVLSNIMIDLYKKYYDLDITEEKVKKYVWAYIPHLFGTPFYVYQYATSFAASFKIYQDVKENKPGAFERYTNLLKAGGSKYPVDEAKDAGVDFTKRETFEAVTNRMTELVDMLEKLLEE